MATLSKSAPSETFRPILVAAGARRLEEAALKAAKALAEYPDDARLTALAGAIEFQRGRFAEALPLLRAANAQFPGDMTVRCNLAETLYQQGSIKEARQLCDRTAIAADKTMRLLRLAAFFAQEDSDFVEAESCYRQLVGHDPDDWSSWNNLGNALSGLRRYTDAIESLSRAARLAPDSGPIRINLANALISAGEIDQATELLTQMAESDAHDATPLLCLFAMYRDLGREDDAYKAIAEAAKRAADDANVRSDYGQEAAKRNDYEIAETEFEAALGLNPVLGPSIVGLASLYERMNREAELEPLLERARTSGVDHASIAYIEALLHRRAGNFEAALQALDAAGEVVVEGRRHHLRGIILDRLKRPDEAFSAFAAMNAHWLRDPSQPRQRAALYRDTVSRDTALIEPSWLSGWSDVSLQDSRPDPVFLVGFPRSGTTLLDTMLMREPRSLVMEEEPFLAELEAKVGGPTNYPDLTLRDIQDGRDYYFERVGTLGSLAPDTMVVDKHPLHLNKVATIQRFFPDARYVLAMRHPCDALLSCFLTNFRINNAMSNFLDLEDAAALYDLTFTHWEKARGVFQLPVKTVVYERLVQDTPRELRPLFEWLGLDWPGDDLDHREAARARGVVHTASYAQVTEPIYSRAMGRWHNYVDHLAPVLEKLRPWVEKFGYSLEDGRIPGWPVEQG